MSHYRNVASVETSERIYSKAKVLIDDQSGRIEVRDRRGNTLEVIYLSTDPVVVASIDGLRLDDERWEALDGTGRPVAVVVDGGCGCGSTETIVKEP